VVTTGIVTAPRGLARFSAMLAVGRLVNRVDSRLLMFTGLALTAYSLYEMMGLLDADG